MKKVELLFLAITLFFSYNLTAQISINSNGSSPNPSAMLDVKSDSLGVLIPNIALSGTTDSTTISGPAVSLLIYNTATINDVTPGYYYNSGTNSAPVWTRFVTTSLAIGDSYQGGVIFWLDATGRHGLIAAATDQSTGIQWYNGATFRYTGASGDGLYAGAMNTAMIVATQMGDNQTGNFAAKVCADYSVTDGGITYGDWYLPSKYELNLLYLQKNAVGGFTTYYYWSSTEINSHYVWRQLFSSGSLGTESKNYSSYVRAIRAF